MYGSIVLPVIVATLLSLSRFVCILDDRISHNTYGINDGLRRWLYGTDVDRDCKYIQFSVNDEYLKNLGLNIVAYEMSAGGGITELDSEVPFWKLPLVVLKSPICHWTPCPYSIDTSDEMQLVKY